MRYDCPVVGAATASAFSSKMELEFSTRPLTSEERVLARNWIRGRVFLAGVVLLSMRMDMPKLSTDELMDMDALDLRGLLLGLMLSIEADYTRQQALDTLEGMSTGTCH